LVPEKRQHGLRGQSTFVGRTERKREERAARRKHAGIVEEHLLPLEGTGTWKGRGEEKGDRKMEMTASETRSMLVFKEKKKFTDVREKARRIKRKISPSQRGSEE